MTHEQFFILLEKFHQRTLSEDEIVLFLKAADDPQFETLMTDKLYDELLQFSATTYAGAEREQKVWQAVKANMQLTQSEAAVDVPVRRITTARRWWAVAAVFLLVGLSTYVWINGKWNTKQQATTHAHEVIPGSDGAILTLADGSSVLLDTVKNGVVALQDGVTARVVNGSLRYEGAGTQVLLNTVHTPVGRQFQMVLPDGTKAWLNAASSIRFPTAFAGNQRSITITGEVYLEVAKNPRSPFRVNVNNKMEVEVLGTGFNCNGYVNEPALHTTVLEGAVKVTHAAEGVVVKAGQQARVANNSAVVQPLTLLNKVDVEQVTAWKNGAFSFEGASLEEVMRQLERWYDIEVVYAGGKIPDIHFFGGISRKESISEVLKALEESKVKFTIEEGRKLVVQAR